MQAGSSDRVDRRLTAILAADVVGYSRLMEADEAGTVRLLREHPQGGSRPCRADGLRKGDWAADLGPPACPRAPSQTTC
jgi:hypothetical protein